MDKPTVLIVENENSFRDTIVNALGKISYDIILAQNGNTGLKNLRDSFVDIVLADQKMPDMTCLDFLKTVKKEYPDIISIMLAEEVDLDTTIRAINEAGVYRFILKPWNSFDLRINISRALELKKIIMEKKLLINEIEKNDALLEKLAKQYPEACKIIDELEVRYGVQ